MLSTKGNKLKISDILKSKETKAKEYLQQLKNKLKQLEQKEQHTVDDIVQYFSTMLTLDDAKNKPDRSNRFNMFSGDYLPLVTASVLNASIGNIKKAYFQVTELYPELYSQGIAAADLDQKRSPITKHPFEFDRSPLRDYREKQYGTRS